MDVVPREASWSALPEDVVPREASWRSLPEDVVPREVSWRAPPEDAVPRENSGRCPETPEVLGVSSDTPPTYLRNDVPQILDKSVVFFWPAGPWVSHPLVPLAPGVTLGGLLVPIYIYMGGLLTHWCRLRPE